jgi:hypothetical protein
MSVLTGVKMIEASISEQGRRAAVSIGAWTAIVDFDEFRAWAAHSGFELLHVGGGLSKLILQDDDDCHFTMLSWSDHSAQT